MNDAIRQAVDPESIPRRAENENKNRRGIMSRVMNRLLGVSLRTWFWVHKGLFAGYMIYLFVHHKALNEQLEKYNRISSLNSERSYYTMLYYKEKMLQSMVSKGVIGAVLLALIILASVMMVLAFTKQTASAEKKRSILKNRRTVIDMVLNIMAVVMLVHGTSAVNYAYLSASEDECSFFAKAALYSQVKKDFRSQTEDVTYTVSDISLDMRDFTYREADISPYVWGLPVPVGNELTVWVDTSESSRKNSVYMDFGEPKKGHMPLYSLTCGEERYSLDRNEFSTLMDWYNAAKADNDAVIEIKRHPNSHFIADFRIVGKNGTTKWYMS